MTAPRFYSWDDDGSPGRALSGNLQNRLKQILVPCLVTGYGSKPGAGWVIGHEHANGFSLINADGNVVNFVSDLPAQAPYPAMNSSAIHIYAAESLTDTSNAIIDGANLCSGNFRKGFAEPSGYQRHILGFAGRPVINELSSLQWVIVADDKTFTLNCSSNSSSAAGVRTYSFSLHAGRPITDAQVTGSFLVLGGALGGYSAVQDMFAYSAGYSSPMDLGTGLGRAANITSLPYSDSPSLESARNLAGIMANLNFQQPRLLYDEYPVGRLRGVVYDDVLRLYSWAEHLRCLGHSGADYNDRCKVIAVDGYNYSFARSNSGNSILTDNPVFW